MTIYGYDSFTSVLEAYEKSGKDYQVYTLAGGLLDSHILTGDGLKTAIFKEIYLNEWSSAYTIRLYNKTPKKYDTIIDLLEEGEKEKAERLFYA